MSAFNILLCVYFYIPIFIQANEDEHAVELNELTRGIERNDPSLDSIIRTARSRVRGKGT